MSGILTLLVIKHLVSPKFIVTAILVYLGFKESVICMEAHKLRFDELPVFNFGVFLHFLAFHSTQIYLLNVILPEGLRVLTGIQGCLGVKSCVHFIL
jgi:hypothetical protein